MWKTSGKSKTYPTCAGAVANPSLFADAHFKINYLASE